MEAAKLIGVLARIVRDVGVAEDLAQDALVSALEQWPRQGIPRNPGAWLMTAAKHRAIDRLRRAKLLDRKHQELGQTMQARELEMPDFDTAPDSDPSDNLLRLMFTACHPVLTPDARVALTLRMLGGLTTDEIARAFLTAEPTIAQRIVRAKRTLAENQIPFEIPEREELADRLSSVLSVLYLIFNEGYSASSGDHWMRPALCEEAMRLGRMLAEQVPREPEVHGLIALMEIQASRFHARTGPSGEPILLLDQNRVRWDGLLIQRGLAALKRGEALGATRGPYLLQATIAACHARARTADATDWTRIAHLYTELAATTPSPVVELGRAVAFSMAFGPEAGLNLVDALAANPDLRGYHRLPSVRGDLLFKLGRFGEAQPEFERAAALATNAQERQMLLDRMQACRLRPINNSDELSKDR
ncbi:MAG: RNA polymerase sigma factor [Bryobacteraceae bacterium]